MLLCKKSCSTLITHTSWQVFFKDYRNVHWMNDFSFVLFLMWYSCVWVIYSVIHTAGIQEAACIKWPTCVMKFRIFWVSFNEISQYHKFGFTNCTVHHLLPSDPQTLCWNEEEIHQKTFNSEKRCLLGLQALQVLPEQHNNNNSRDQINWQGHPVGHTQNITQRSFHLYLRAHNNNKCNVKLE